MTHHRSIRRARATDLAYVYAGELDYIRQIEPDQEQRWKDGMLFHLRQWTQDLDRMFIVECAGEYAGYSFWEIHAETAVLASIYVIPERRRTGLGQLLLKQFVSDARASGITEISLGVKADNPARYLYEQSGFVHSHDERGYCHYMLPIEHEI
ncbi:GNAT family N-acetyltransferase [Burkholderia gladioli]|uniref:GNAT family N-acetyltransferase n=1 Tax=Burkholderia gladioli TaxID=28095 RepID=UPI001641BD8E|nr:GNAT family N-acetyltransferase [Burkholderia gladioli]